MSDLDRIPERSALRLFYGLPLPLDVAERLAAWARATLEGRPTVRVLAPSQLHVTLAFLGRRPAGELPALRGALDDATAGLERPLLAIECYRETRSVAMVELGDLGGGAAKLQERLVERLEELGVYQREQRPWLAHVTLARLRERPRLRPELPELAPFRPTEVALYESLLSRGGARYEIIGRARLGSVTES